MFPTHTHVKFIAMPVQLYQLGIFVSCPEEMSAERELVESAAAEVAKHAETAYGVTFKVLTWRNSVVPGIGSDPQSVISKQLAGKYDIYIGLLGARFGTPTPRAGSGTEDEFNSAFDRYTGDPTSVRVLFYFKTSVQAIYNLDLSQLEKVKSFREKLYKAGVLFSDFSDSREFLERIKDHLTRLIADQWASGHWKASEKPAELTVATAVSLAAELTSSASVSGDLDQPGLFDLIAVSLDHSANANAAMDEITKSMQFLHERIQDRVKNRGTDFASIRKFTDLSAMDILEFAKSLQRQVPIIDHNYRLSIDFAEQVLVIYLGMAGFSDDDAKKMIDALRMLSSKLSSFNEQMSVFRNQVTSVPNLTSSLARATRSVAREIDSLSAAAAILASRAEQIAKRAEQRGSQSSPPKH
jgi:hypothetical protein